MEHYQELVRGKAHDVAERVLEKAKIVRLEAQSGPARREKLIEEIVELEEALKELRTTYRISKAELAHALKRRRERVASNSVAI